jgi:hypothetical protein
MSHFRSSGNNVFHKMTPAERVKLTAIEDSATADQTGAEIKTAYEGEADTNALTDARATKLDDIDAIVVDTSTAYLTTDADDGKTITMNNASASTFKIHATAPAGFRFKVVQIGVGKVTASMNAGGTLNTNEAGLIMNQNDVAEFVVVSNAGTAPEVYAWGGLNAT